MMMLNESYTQLQLQMKNKYKTLQTSRLINKSDEFEA